MFQFRICSKCVRREKRASLINVSNDWKIKLPLFIYNSWRVWRYQISVFIFLAVCAWFLLSLPFRNTEKKAKHFYSWLRASNFAFVFVINHALDGCKMAEKRNTSSREHKQEKQFFLVLKGSNWTFHKLISGCASTTQKCSLHACVPSDKMHFPVINKLSQINSSLRAHLNDIPQRHQKTQRQDDRQVENCRCLRL